MIGHVLAFAVKVAVGLLLLALLLRSRPAARWILRTGLLIVGVEAAVVAYPFAMNAIRPMLIGSHVDRLKSYIAPEVLSRVDPKFFTNAGYWDDTRLPLVFPYDLIFLEPSSCAAVRRESADLPDLGKITDIAFDGRFLLMRRQERKCPVSQQWSERPKWGLFEFATAKADWFDDEDDFDVEVARRGYKGETKLLPVTQAYREYFFP